MRGNDLGGRAAFPRLVIDFHQPFADGDAIMRPADEAEQARAARHVEEDDRPVIPRGWGEGNKEDEAEGGGVDEAVMDEVVADCPRVAEAPHLEEVGSDTGGEIAEEERQAENERGEEETAEASPVPEEERQREEGENLVGEEEEEFGWSHIWGRGHLDFAPCKRARSGISVSGFQEKVDK